MAEMPVVLRFPDELINELAHAAQESGCSPTAFVSQSIEAALASRRLPHVNASSRASSPRVPGWQPEPEDYADPEEDCAGPLEPVDVPTADDLQNLDGIS
jgi:hypothetical protein